MTLRTLQVDEPLFRYVLEHSLREHPAQAALREATRTHPHAGMQISPDQGQFMAFDNTLWNGAVARPAADDDTRALQALNERLHHDERIDLALLTVCDGLALARKR